MFPLATSITALTVMFGVLLQLNVTIALLSLTVVPFLYLCLRYYTSTLVNREERVKELESKLLERLYETFGAMRLVKSFAREPHELQRYAATASTDDERADRDHLAAVAVLGRASARSPSSAPRSSSSSAARYVMSGELTIGELTVVISYLGAVYGPLSAIAHTTGQLQGALAGARRVRAMFALMPETVEAPDAIDAVDDQGRHPRSRTSASRIPNGTRGAARHHASRPSRARSSRSSASPAPARRRWSA